MQDNAPRRRINSCFIRTTTHTDPITEFPPPGTKQEQNQTTYTRGCSRVRTQTRRLAGGRRRRRLRDHAQRPQRLLQLSQCLLCRVLRALRDWTRRFGGAIGRERGRGVEQPLSRGNQPVQAEALSGVDHPTGLRLQRSIVLARQQRPDALPKTRWVRSRPEPNAVRRKRGTYLHGFAQARQVGSGDEGHVRCRHGHLPRLLFALFRRTGNG